MIYCRLRTLALSVLWASSGGTCHFLHSLLLIGLLCISNEANVAATKALIQSCGGKQRSGRHILQSELACLTHAHTFFSIHHIHFSSPGFAVILPVLSSSFTFRQHGDKKRGRVFLFHKERSPLLLASKGDFVGKTFSLQDDMSSGKFHF